MGDTRQYIGREKGNRRLKVGESRVCERVYWGSCDVWAWTVGLHSDKRGES